MQVEVRLLHMGSDRCVVAVRGLEGAQLLGEALGQAADAETAEDRALARLQQRLRQHSADLAGSNTAAPPAVAAQARPPRNQPRPLAAGASEPGSGREQVDPGTQGSLLIPAPAPAPPAAPTANGSGTRAQEAPAPPPPAPAQTGMGSLAPGPGLEAAAAHPAGPANPLELEPPLPLEQANEPTPDPEDWSQELSQLDLALQRLGWGREQEGVYLQRAFGHPSRSRLTTYADLLAYLRALEGLEHPVDPALAAVPLRRRDLLRQCDELLQQLGWDGERGRRQLEQQLGVSSRQQLNDQQLLAFNMHLEEELLALPAAGEA